MTFKSAYLKLTLFYVLIVMLISVIFSIVLFNVSSRELNFGLRRQSDIFRNLPPRNTPFQSLEDLEKIRIDQLETSRINLGLNLIYLNLIILGLSASLSYWLAKRTLQPIEEMLETQRRFTADASHELRTPLAAIKTEIEVNLRNKKLNLQDAKDLLRSNLEEVGKLENLSNALLRLAQYEEGKNLIFEKISLEEIIVEAFQRIEKSAQNKEIEFENYLQNLKIYGDRASLTELFVVLLDNAIKYSPKKSKIFISINKLKNSSNVEIRDQGTGIKALDIPYIFNRFYRADPSRSKTQTNGYGLGLSIAKKIIDLHKGSIKVSSQPDKGSIFTVMFPNKKL